jgi:hypothetical protein
MFRLAGYVAILLAMPLMWLAGFYTPGLDRPPNFLLDADAKRYGGTALIFVIAGAASVIAFLLSSTDKKLPFHYLAGAPLVCAIQFAALAANSAWQAKGATHLLMMSHALPLLAGGVVFLAVFCFFLLKALKQPVVQ